MNTPQEFIANYERGLAAQSWSAIAPLIHERCVVTFNEGTHVGKPQVEAAFRKTFALIKDETYTIRNIHWVQETETSAVLTYEFDWSGKINGQPASGSGRGTSVLTRQSGSWQLLCEHLGPPARTG